MYTPPRWFVRRPHAVNQMRTRGQLGVMADVDVENLLRNALDKAWSDVGPDGLLPGREANDKLLRIIAPSTGVVLYAVLHEASSYDDYDYVIPTVLTKEMYDGFNMKGTLGSLGDVAAVDAVRQTKVVSYKEMITIVWEDAKGVERVDTYCLDDVSDAVNKLLDQKVPRDKIRLFKEVPFRLSVDIPETKSKQAAAG